MAGIGGWGRQAERRETRTFQERGDILTKKSRKPCPNKTNTTIIDRSINCRVYFSEVAISSRKIEDSQKPAIKGHHQKRVGQRRASRGPTILCFCLDKHRFLPTPSGCQRHSKRNKDTFFFLWKMNCASADWSAGVVLRASQRLL